MYVCACMCVCVCERERERVGHSETIEGPLIDGIDELPKVFTTVGKSGLNLIELTRAGTGSGSSSRARASSTY